MYNFVKKIECSFCFYLFRFSRKSKRLSKSVDFFNILESNNTTAASETPDSDSEETPPPATTSSCSEWLQKASKEDPLPPASEFLDFLRKRALDDSVFVRKNALQVLENLLRLGGSELSSEASEEILGVLTEHCRDASLMIRKQMVGSLSELVRQNPGSSKT